MPRDLRAYLFDIAQACGLVLEFTKGRSAESYATDPMLRSAVERQLEIAGEALSQALRNHAAALADRIPEAPRIIAFRNQLAHGYASVVDDIVWAIVERDVPALVTEVAGYLEQLDPAQAKGQRPPAPGAIRRWTNDELWRALGDYEAKCRMAGMTGKAIHSYWDYARRFLAWRQGDYTPRGMPTNRRSSPAPATTAHLATQVDEYVAEVEAAGRHEATIDTYRRHAMFFVRWLAGDFKPGSRLTGES